MFIYLMQINLSIQMVKDAFRTSLYILRFEWFENKMTETFSLFRNSNRTPYRTSKLLYMDFIQI